MPDQRKARSEVAPSTPNVDLKKRLIDATLADFREIVQAELCAFIEGETPLGANDASLLDRAGAAKFLSISTAQVDKLIRDKALPFHRVGDVKRFDRDEIRAWVKAQGT